MEIRFFLAPYVWQERIFYENFHLENLFFFHSPAYAAEHNVKRILDVAKVISTPPTHLMDFHRSQVSIFDNFHIRSLSHDEKLLSLTPAPLVKRH